MSANAKEIISSLNLLPHPEGGFYKETYRSDDKIPGGIFPSFTEERSIATGIYFLLEKGNKSVFHRIKSDEAWHHYDGGALEILEISKTGELKTILLGKNSANGEVYQYLVPAGVWFGSRPAESTEFALVGCTVAPGFDFADFEMANREELIKEFPDHSKTIEELT